MSFFDTLLASVEAGAATLAQDELGSLLPEAKSDATAFVVDSRASLERWAKLRRDGLITNRELADLIHAQVTLAQMAALTHAGIALTRLDRFKAGLSQLIISSAIKALAI